MKRLVAHLRDYGAAWLMGGIATSVVLASILAGEGGPFRHTTGAAVRTGDEVSNFVLFTTVPYRDLSVTTGTEFASMTDRSITSQWCYLRRDGRDGDLVPWVELASARSGASPSLNPLSSSALAALGLTSPEAARLVTTHCRFQRES
ncbi:hypothetical protein MWN34_10875 [Ancylobacter sp. 6x-1]|uniref:Uncharacterized protein n=1 Tax=Ancylobacter crimeensis TaxID=2579147 RepID=A0ABT0DBS5_9HYPH|nr:hypothetical protein [Ancylobacter crimeensis]MCK0197416.1 hypothetical protein [Ancylobacter crimeensis]